MHSNPLKTVKNLLFFGFLVLLLSQCQAQKGKTSYGTLAGITGIYEGNCMPAYGQPPCKPRPAPVTILVCKPTDTYTEDALILKVTSNEDGTFSQRLPVGKYSLFLLDDDGPYCPVTECPDACYCQLVEILPNQTTEVKLNLDHASW